LLAKLGLQNSDKKSRVTDEAKVDKFILKSFLARVNLDLVRLDKLMLAVRLGRTLFTK